MPPKAPPKARSKEAEEHAAALAMAGIKTRANASEKSLRAMAKVLNAKAPVDPSTGEKEQLTYTNAEERSDMRAAGGAGTTENNDAGIESYVKKGEKKGDSKDDTDGGDYDPSRHDRTARQQNIHNREQMQRRGRRERARMARSVPGLEAGKFCLIVVSQSSLHECTITLTSFEAFPSLSNGAIML